MRVDVRLDRETVWLTQRQMSEVFDTTPENVLMHLRNVFAGEELAADATTKKFLVVRTEGSRQVKRQIKHYNLDAIISVGYRSFWIRTFERLWWRSVWGRVFAGAVHWSFPTTRTRFHPDARYARYPVRPIPVRDIPR